MDYKIEYDEKNNPGEISYRERYLTGGNSDFPSQLTVIHFVGGQGGNQLYKSAELLPVVRILSDASLFLYFISINCDLIIINQVKIIVWRDFR